MFGRSRKSPAARAELRCSFCNKGERDVRKLIAGPVVFICDECVDVCVSILAHDRRASGEAGSKSTGSTAGAARWPSSDAWCAFCGNVADLENALLIENRTLLCEPCVQAIAAAASQGQKAN